MFVPIVTGSDKTTVSVATGQQEYHPVYVSIGNLSNTMRRAHGNGVLAVAFLPIPKGKFLFDIAHFYDSHYATSIEVTTWAHRIPALLSSAVSRVSSVDFRTIEALYDGTAYSEVSRWKLSPCCVWFGTLHCGLPRASLACRHCVKLVCEVSPRPQFAS